MATKRLRALSYLRVSGKDQARADRHGFDRQRDTISRYAKKNGVEIINEFQDAGVSGTKELEHREGLSECLVTLRSNGIDVVLVERADRLARDLVVGELILNQFRGLGVRVVAADSGTDLTAGTDDPTSVLIRQVLGAVSEFEKSVLVQKLSAARLRRRRDAGRCEGRKPFGARDGEAEVVDQIFRLRQGHHLSFGAIAKELNTEGVKTRMGQPWGPSTVQSIVKRGRPKQRQP